MKKAITRVKFLDATSKEFISRKLKDVCYKVINDYNNDPSIASPILRVGKYKDGDWDPSFKEGMTSFRKADLNNYADKDGVLDVKKVTDEFYAFITDCDLTDENVPKKDTWYRVRLEYNDYELERNTKMTFQADQGKYGYLFLTEDGEELSIQKEDWNNLLDIDYSVKDSLGLGNKRLPISTLTRKAVALSNGKSVRVYHKEDLLELISIAEEYHVFNPEHKEIKTPGGIHYEVSRGSKNVGDTNELEDVEVKIEEETEELHDEVAGTAFELSEELEKSMGEGYVSTVEGNVILYALEEGRNDKSHQREVTKKAQDIAEALNLKVKIAVDEGYEEDEDTFDLTITVLSNLKDADEVEDDQEVEEEIIEPDGEEEVEEEDDEPSTYREYLTKELETIETNDFRYYLVKIILGQDKGWSYLKKPSDLEGNKFDVVTPKNIKKIIKIFKESKKQV